MSLKLLFVLAAVVLLILVAIFEFFVHSIAQDKDIGLLSLGLACYVLAQVMP
jgi:hypothetical protein